MKGKLILALLLLTGGTILVISRKIGSAAGRQSQKNLINKIKRKPAEAVRIAAQLDIVMEKRNAINQQAFGLIKNKIQSSATIGNYKILHTVPIGDSLLFFTELHYTDFDVTFTGHAGDVQKKAHHNFLLTHSAPASQLDLSSDMFSDSTSRMQKQDFIEALFRSTT